MDNLEAVLLLVYSLLWLASCSANDDVMLLRLSQLKRWNEVRTSGKEIYVCMYIWIDPGGILYVYVCIYVVCVDTVSLYVCACQFGVLSFDGHGMIERVQGIGMKN